VWVRTGFRLRVIIQKGFLVSPAANQKGPKPLNSGPFDCQGQKRMAQGWLLTDVAV
jgi:hypothetical protein